MAKRTRKTRDARQLERDHRLQARDVVGVACVREALATYIEREGEAPDLGTDDIKTLVTMFREAPSYRLFKLAHDNIGAKTGIPTGGKRERNLVARLADVVLKGGSLVLTPQRDTIARAIRLTPDAFARINRAPGATLSERVLHLLDAWERAGGAA